jgi:DNA-binding IscR family transcriptional regulator
LDALRCIEGVDTARLEETPDSEAVGSHTVKEVWIEAEQAANAVWQKYTLQDLCERLSARRQLDNMYYI